MKLLRSLAAAGLALALYAATTYAQGSSLGWGQKAQPSQSGTNPQGALKVGIVGGVKNDSTAAPLRMGSYGETYTSEVNPIYDMNWKMDNFFAIDSLGVTILADSSGWIDTHRYKTMWMYVFPSVSASTTNIRVALQVRGSTTGATDSSGVMPWYRGMFGAAGGSASTGFNGWGTDSLGCTGTGATAAGGSMSAFSNEITLILPVNTATTRAGGFRGIPVPLYGWWAPYTQFRFRLINSPAQINLRCTLVGTPL